MRVVISAPRKSGGAQLRCMLSMAFDLKAPPSSAPSAIDPVVIDAWIAGLPEGSVTTCDLPLAVLVDPVSNSGVHLVGVIRHPFDLFVSNFDVAQQRAARGQEADEGHLAWSILSGEDLAGETTREYALAGFASEVKALREWVATGRAIRYEALLEDPAAILSSLASALGALTREQVEHAVGLCPPENVVTSRPGRGRRMPSLPPGAWRDRLPDSLIVTLQEQYDEDVIALGYDLY